MSASGLPVAEEDGGLGEMKVSRDFWQFCRQMSSEQLLWRRSVEHMKRCMRIFAVCHFCKFVCSLQCNKLGWNVKFITCTRPLFFQCFHCNCIVENCGMFLEKKKVINVNLACWKLLWKFSIYSQYLYILSPSLSVPLYLSFPGRCLLTWVWSILNLQLNINLQVKHSWWVANIRVSVLCSQWCQTSLFSLEVECSCLTSTAALALSLRLSCHCCRAAKARDNVQ